MQRMDAVVFSWSGSFRERFDEREQRLERFQQALDAKEVAVGVVTEGEKNAVAEKLSPAFVVPHVQDLAEVLSSLLSRYEKVFLVTDVGAEIATANKSGAFTVGFNSAEIDAEELAGFGPNYIVDSLDEMEEILKLESLR